MKVNKKIGYKGEENKQPKQDKYYLVVFLSLSILFIRVKPSRETAVSSATHSQNVSEMAPDLD